MPEQFLAVRRTYHEKVEQALASLGIQANNQLVFYGATGMGKTGLMRSLEQAHRAQCSVLNGATVKRAGEAGLEHSLGRLRNELERDGIRLKPFDLAYAYYLKWTYPGQSFDATQFGRRRDQGDTISTFGDLVGAVGQDLGQQIPFVGTISKLSWFALWFIQSPWEDKDLLKPFENCAEPSEVLEQLPELLMSSLKRYLAEHNRQIVILVDHYEDLLDPTGHCEWLADMMAAPNPHVLWVLFARQPLDSIAPAHQVPLVPLPMAEALQWLQTAGIEDSEIRQTIAAAAKGMPGNLAAAIDTWRRIQQRRTPRTTDFARTASEILPKAAQGWEADERQLWQALAIAETWDLELFEWIGQSLEILEWQAALVEVSRSPYVEAVTAFNWRLIEPMREYLLETLSPAAQDHQHQQLSTYYRARYESSGDREALLLVLHHGVAEELNTSAPWILQQTNTLQAAARYRETLPVLRALSQVPTLKSVEAQHQLGRALQWIGDGRAAIEVLEGMEGGTEAQMSAIDLDLAQTYRLVGRTFDAMNAAQRAMQRRTGLYGAASLELADVLNLLAELALDQDRGREAISYSQRALQIYQSQPQMSPLQLADLKKTAALIYVREQRLDEAKRLCQEAQSLAVQAAGAEHPVALLSQALLGNVYELMGQHKYAAAFEQYQQALDGAELVLGVDHPQTLTLLTSLVRLCRKQKRLDAANFFAERLNVNIQLSHFEATAATALRLNNLGTALYRKGQYGKAEPLLLQSLEICRKVLGAEHPDTANSLNNLAALYDTQGRYEESEPLLLQSLQIRRKVLGAEHPDTANNLAALYQAQGRDEETESS